MDSQGSSSALGATTLWPTRKADRVLALLCLSIVAFSGLLLLTYPFARDQGIYAVIGEGLVHGKMPYRDLWDVKTPGIFCVFAVAEVLFGHTMVGPRIIEAFCLFATAFVFVDLGRKYFGDTLVGYIAAAVLSVIHFQMDFWHTSQPETYGGMLLVWAMWLLSMNGVGRVTLRATIVGLLFGGVVLMKPHLGLCVPWLALSTIGAPHRECWRSVLRQYLAVVGGIVLVAVCCALWLRLGGAWDIAVWTWRDFAPGYAMLGSDRTLSQTQGDYYSSLIALTFQISGFIGVGLVLFLSLTQPSTPERKRFWSLAATTAILALAVLLQHKSFKYHYAAAFPTVALAAAAGWGALWRLAAKAPWRYSALFLCAIVATYFCRYPVTDLHGTINQRTHLRLKGLFGSRLSQREETRMAALDVLRTNFDLSNAREVAEWLKKAVAPHERVLLWGCDSVIYWLSERDPASRFIHNIPQRSSWQMRTAQSLYMADVRASVPKAIVVQHGDDIAAVVGNHDDSASALRGFPELAQYLQSAYRHAVTIGLFDVYLRQY